MEEKKTYKRHRALRIYDISRWFYLHHMKPIAQLFFRINNVVNQCSIAYEADIHKTANLCHARGFMVYPGTVVEEGTIIFQQVVLGSKYPYEPAHIHIGKNCMIGVNSCILGDVTIGDNVQIGANVVVLKDIPSNSIVIGAKAQIIKK